MDQKNVSIIALGLIALVLLSTVYDYYQKPAPPLSNQNPPAATPSPTPPLPSSKSQIKTPTKPTQGLSYQQALQEYAGRMMQFDANCRATPNLLTFKNGTEVMFDNRAPDKQTVKLDGKAYEIGAFGFVAVVLNSKALPHTIKVDCGALYSVAQITLQK